MGICIPTFFGGGRGNRSIASQYKWEFTRQSTAFSFTCSSQEGEEEREKKMDLLELYELSLG